MTRLLEILISLAIVAVLFLVVGLVLPSSRHLVETVETNRKLTIVFDTLNSLRRFKDWNPLVLRDPQGADAPSPARRPAWAPAWTTAPRTRAWARAAGRSPKASRARASAYALTDTGAGREQAHLLHLSPTGRNNRNVEITQTYDVDYGWNLLGRYAGMYVSSNVGDDMKLGLSRISNMLAAVPNYDYAELSKDDPAMAPRVQDRPAENLLSVTAVVARDNEAVARQMQSNLEWIRRVMAANGLEAAGPVRIITNEFGAESYSFDVAMPVRRRAGGAAAPAANADADAGAAQPAAAAPAGDTPELTNLNLDGPVEYVRSPASKVAMVPFKGHMANLSVVRDALRAWALTHGYESTERPYEAWKSGIEGGFREDGEFEVFWAVR